MGRKSRSKKRQPAELRDTKRYEQTTSAENNGAGALPAPSSLKKWLFASALVAAVLLAYQPAWHGGFVWDDDEHITRPELRSAQGLQRIWFDVGATLQYYPLLHSAFWVEHKLWGDSTLGYHLVNLFLHAAAALMFASILQRLAIPGAWLAAMVFALHPVHVESVAWMTEQKNTLSAVFYLGAALLYLRFDRTRKMAWYLSALGVFALALLSKTVTGTLPAALLVIFWWQRGELSWKKDVLPLAPLFLLGTCGGMITARYELEINNCVGPEFDFTALQRILIAGRAAWFHLGKLLWPESLAFMYPLWQINTSAWWQFLFPLAVVAALAVAWAIRHRTRAPLAALLYFGGTLVPVLGFFNLYTFRYSFVANHYQYLASLGIITLFSAGVTLLLKRAEGWSRLIRPVGCGALLAVLAVLTWRQSRIYADADSLWNDTLAKDPNCWMAHNNLGRAMAGRGQTNEAIDHYRKALEIKPDFVEAHNNLGTALAESGQVGEAIVHYRSALHFKPDDAEVHFNLGNALAGLGQFDEAIVHFRTALEIKPNIALGRNNLGLALAGLRRFDEAIVQYGMALEIDPNLAVAHYNFGNALAGRGQIDEAAAHYRKALATNPNFALAHLNLGNALTASAKADGSALTSRAKVDEALTHYQKALEIKPDLLEAHVNLGNTLTDLGKSDEALPHYQTAIDLAVARNDGALANAIRAKMRQAGKGL
jgi:protein O-mannosyl-transferase